MIKSAVKLPFAYLKTLIKWLAISTLVGLVGGALGSIFHITIDYVTKVREENSWLIFMLPFGGILIAAVYSIFKSKGRLDTNRVLDAATTEERVPVIMAPLIFVSTAITHLLGGSAGREGAALQLGGSIAYNFGRVFRLNKGDMHIAVMAGMSAVFAAMFGTPLTAAFFAIEVVCVGVMHYVALVPCVVSALTAFWVSKLFGIPPVRFDGALLSALSIDIIVKVIILAVLCALVSTLFCFAIKKCEHYMEKYLPNSYIKAFIGGIIIVGLTYILGTTDYNGAGMGVISSAISGEARYEAFILKILFTAITIAAGFRGGEIVPSFFIGATFGCVAGGLLGIDAGFAAAIGLVAVFCGVVNCPIASLILSLELFGADNILLFALVCAISYMMSGYSGLYHSQKIAFSKLDEEYIDINTK